MAKKNFLAEIMGTEIRRNRKSFGYELASITPEEMSKWDELKMAAQLAKARSAFKTRLQSLERNELTSYAALQYYGEDAETVSRRIRSGDFMFGDYSDMEPHRRRNKEYQELMRIQSFFQAKTSDRQGIEKVNKEQDRRIFGVEKFGRPKYTMTREERDEFWSLYREYQNNHPEDFFGQGQSEKIQMMIGEIWTRSDFTPNDLADAMDKLKARFEGRLEPELKKSSKTKTPERFSHRGRRSGNVRRGRGNRSR